MECGINNHLRRISSELFIKYDSAERKKINNSVAAIVRNLEEYFGDQIDEAIIFGSYERDTILPRKFDLNSDIDILIQFNTVDYEKLKPESYRNQLKKFTEIRYPNSKAAKDHPSIVLELSHISFDLVPAIFDDGIFYDSIEIPNKNGDWMETQPKDFNDKLIRRNKKYNSIVKPLIRLMKYWNASNGYPYNSYELEMQIANMDFEGNNYESGFLYAVRKLSANKLPEKSTRKIDMLKSDTVMIIEYLERDDIDKAKNYLNKILPGTF